MDIKYIGHASFFIKTKNARVVTDPYDTSIGLKYPKTEADIVTVSHGHPDHNKVDNISGNPLVIDWPGEFEKQDVRVFGFQSFHDDKKGAERGENIVYKIEADGISILHCGDLGHLLDDKLLEEIGEVNILMIPVGGYYTIDANQAAQCVKKIEPSIVIPMHYATPQHDQKLSSVISPVDEFLAKMGAEGTQPVPKLTLKAEDLSDEMKIVVLEPGA